QAEDGIRDRNVTGVQTCALPIWCVPQECSMTWVWLLAEVWVAAWPVRAPCLGVTRPASPECASPLYWGLVCGGRCVACSWSPCGRGGCRWRGLSACSSMFEGVGGCAGRRLGRLVACWWTTFACSRVLVGLLVVVSVVWVACWWTTFVVLGWAC